MQQVINDFKQVVAAPLLVVLHDVFEDSIDFLDDLHVNQGLQFDFAGVNYNLDDLDGEGIELRMVDIEILEEHIDQLKLVQDHHEGRVPLHHH